MLPLLQLTQDGEEHSLGQAVEAAIVKFGLTEEEQAETLPSGAQTIHNRIAWARHHLVKAGLLSAPRRGRFKITERGREFLEASPADINVGYLYLNSRVVRAREEERYEQTSLLGEATTSTDISRQTPQELLENSFLLLQRQLAQDLLERIGKCSPAFFERLVVDLLVSMGYGGSRKDAGQAIGKSGDEGIDGIIKQDRLGLDAVYVQAKRWTGTVGRPAVQAFAGSLEGHRARKGVFITTSQFSADAKDYVNRIEKRIILIDGQQLAELSIEYRVGVAEVTSYSVKRLDLDYFEED